MRIKLLHLNMMFEAYYLDAVIAYIKKNEFDIINLQEVAGGSISFGKDNYRTLREALSDYHSVFDKRFSTDDDLTSYFGNAIFFKSDFSLIENHVIWLNEKRIMPKDWKGYLMEHKDELPYNAQHLVLQKAQESMHLVNCHLPWGPTPSDEPFKLKADRILFEYVKQSVRKPFILSGDFNLTPQSEVVKWFDSWGRNLTVEHKVTNTLNPRTHKAKHLFPPGLTVDYIYVSDDITVKSFEVVENDLSDHLGLQISCEFSCIK